MLAFKWALFVGLLRFWLLCGTAGVPGAGCVGPGCFVCPWAAARPRAVRAASFARRVGSKPGQAPPPPTGAAARPSIPSGALHTSGARCAVGWLGALARSPARPRHHPRAPQPGPYLYPASRPQPLTSPVPEPHSISHVIPPRPFQTINSQRWNCNVFRLY